MLEKWAVVPGHPGYQVSNMGHVKSCARVIVRNNGRRQTIKERILKPSNDEWGYPMVRIDRKTYKIHRIVALVFLPDRPPNTEIRHLDGNPQNNIVSNLAYGSHSENVLDGYAYRGKIKAKQKLSLSDVKAIKSELMCGSPGRELAGKYNISEQTICDIKHNRIYAHVEVSQ